MSQAGKKAYEKYEGAVIDAIDSVFLHEWWRRLSDETQEEIHDALYRAFVDKPKGG